MVQAQVNSQESLIVIARVLFGQSSSCSISEESKLFVESETLKVDSHKGVEDLRSMWKTDVSCKD